MEEERPINFLLLRKDELEYEARIRGAEPASKVIDLRAQVRKLSKELPSDEIAEVDLDIVSEFHAVKDKLAYLNDLIVGAGKPTCTLKLLNRVEAVAHHLYHRLSRLIPTEESPVTTENLDSLRENLDQILHKLDNFMYNFKSGLSQRRHSNSIPPPIPAEDMAIGTDSVTPPTVSPAKEITYYNNGSGSAIHKLGITYNGTTCVKAFLQRLDELCRSRGITDSRLFNSAAELFTDEALSWYRGILNEVNDWAQLKDLLLVEYLPSDYDQKLMQELLSRTQGPDESIVNYLSIMKNYFIRLSTPLSDKVMLDIVMLNIQPYYSTQLALEKTDTWAELKRKCKLVEVANDRARRFTNPPVVSSSSVAPDLGYKPKSSRPAPKVAAVEAPEIPSSFCVRCRVKGHSLKSCTAPFVVICYRCGEKDVTARTCPKCRPAGNTPARAATIPKNVSS